MYDLYGDIIVLTSKVSLDSIYRLLAQGYTKIFNRTPVSELYRTITLEWVSPFQEKPNSSRYLNRENNLLFYGDLKEVYYNPRYANERLQLKKFFTSFGYTLEDLGVIGSGISPYSITLSPFFNKITDYDINLKALYYANINIKTNLKCSNITLKKEYKNEIHQVLISVMPSLSLKLKNEYKFKEALIVYHLCQDSEIEEVKKNFAFAYNLPLEFIVPVVARKYSLTQSIYRIFMTFNPEMLKKYKISIS